MIHPDNIALGEVSLMTMMLHMAIYDEEACMHILKVPGGWIYDFWDGEKGVYKQGTFVPEPK